MENEIKLLLLEDNPSDVDLIQLLLRRAGLKFSAVVASDENEFHEALQTNNFDAVLADNSLPQYSSVEALKIVQSVNTYVAFILVTGTVSEEFAVKIIKQGADDYILKTNLTRLPSAILGAIEKKRIQKDKERLDVDLRRITAHMEEIREKEQRRIAREVHDQLGQLLTGLKMDLAWVKKRLANNNKETVIEKLNEMSGLLDEAVGTVRKVASDIRPNILDDFGLADALEWQSSEFEKKSGVPVHYSQWPEKIEIDTHVTTALFRIYQEILTNIARHAEANKVITRLEVAEEKIFLTVTDNGKGFDSTISVKSLGLLGMKERAYMVGGVLNINSQPGNGTTISVEVPLKNSNYHHEALKNQ